jgi:hypothetical protein
MLLACPNCVHATLPSLGLGESVQVCRTCQSEVQLLVFPTALEPEGAAMVPMSAVGAEGTCFYCPSHAATASCQSCGAYVCGRCQVMWFGRLLCLSCLHTQREKQTTTAFQHRAVLYDNLSLLLILVPLAILYFGWFLLFLTVPISLVLVLWHWRKPGGLLPRSPLRRWAALVLGLGLIALFCVGVASLIHWWPRPSHSSRSVHRSK